MQTPGAGPSKHRPPPIPIHSPGGHLDSSAPKSNVRARTPTRTSTAFQEVELGVYLTSERSPRTPSILISSSPSKAHFPSSKPSPSSHAGEFQSKNLLLTGSEWRTDIVTFCSHARLDSALGRAHITHIQARKSRRPPFLHEYILVFFTVAHSRRFVARIDRLGKVGSTSGGLLGWCAGRHGMASNTAIQQIGVYHVQDDHSGIDNPDGPWCAGDHGWGSDPIATLVTWSYANESRQQVSHHVQNAATLRGPIPRLGDVSRLLEAILLEMPTYHLVTTNCYFMTRSSLLLLHRCFPNSFACYMGSTAGDLIPSAELSEPIWAGLLRWYLPFAIVMFLIYFPLVVVVHLVAGNLITCGRIKVCSAEDLGNYVYRRMVAGFRIAIHGAIDVPLPLGMLHAWMTALEVRMNDLVLRLSTQYHALERSTSGSTLLLDPQPFGVAFQKAWLTFAAWCGIGLALSLILFVIVIASPIVQFIFFLLFVVAAIYFNFNYSDSDLIVAGTPDITQQHVAQSPKTDHEADRAVSRTSSVEAAPPTPAQ